MFVGFHVIFVFAFIFLSRVFLAWASWFYLVVCFGIPVKFFLLLNTDKKSTSTEFQMRAAVFTQQVNWFFYGEVIHEVGDFHSRAIF